MKKYLIFAAAALMMTACDEAIQNDVVGDGGTIHLTATVSSGGGATRASATGNLQDTEFASGKQIFVEAYETGETTPYTSGDYTTGDAGALSGSLRYPANNQAIDLCAYYPNSISSVSDAFAIQTDQREVVNYQASDLMYATKLTNKSSGSDHNLEFNHALTKIVVNIVAGAGLTSDNITTSPGVTAVKIKNTLPNASLVIDNGVITASKASTGSAADINITGTGASNVGIIVPQEVPAGAFITLTYNSVDYTYNLPAAKTFEAGKLYTYTFTLAAKGLSLTATSINNWTAGEGGETEIGMESKWTDLTFTVGDANFHMIYVKGGATFTNYASTGFMAATNTSLRITQDYYIGQTEVTQALWKAVMGSNPSNYNDNVNNPVEMVSWQDICQSNGFLDRLNAAVASQLPTGMHFKLPTEGQWEYAARGGIYSKGYTYAGSNTIGDVAWCQSNSSGKTHPVGQKQPNELELYDMSGNVWEWCYEYQATLPNNTTLVDPAGATSGSWRVMHGGSCIEGEDGCIVTYRGRYGQTARINQFGFRLVLQ